jgi:large subunit ribosomal protein L18
MNPKVQAREKRKMRLRKHIRGTSERPRLSIFCSGRHIYAQIINDESGRTLAAASTLSESIREGDKALANIAGAKKVGKAIAEIALAQEIGAVVFDRSGYLYHGKVKALADAAREAGLQF